MIEYCGGTELGGSYIGSTMVQDNVPATFSTVAFGIKMHVLDEDGKEVDEGQVFLEPPSMGFSQELVNRDHHETYFANTPNFEGKLLRRHGDFMVKLSTGYFAAGGRADDTMNLGGIKISSVEIERVLNGIENIRETAAVAVPFEDSGPDQLAVFAVLKDSTQSVSEPDLRLEMNQQLKTLLNPLFKIRQLIVVESMPRTASNKVMRRKLRDQLLNVSPS